MKIFVKMTCKNHKICIRMSEEDVKRILCKSKLLGLSVGQYMRFISLQADIEIVKVMSDKSLTNDIKRRKLN